MILCKVDNVLEVVEITPNECVDDTRRHDVSIERKDWMNVYFMFFVLDCWYDFVFSLISSILS